PSSTDSIHFVRLMPDGSLDPAFNNSMAVIRPPWEEPLWPDQPSHWGQFALPDHHVLSDGRILLHGSHYIIDDHYRGGLAMLDENGYLMEEIFDSGGCGAFLSSEYSYLNYDIYDITETPEYIYIYGAYLGYD